MDGIVGFQGTAPVALQHPFRKTGYGAALNHECFYYEGSLLLPLLPVAIQLQVILNAERRLSVALYRAPRYRKSGGSGRVIPKWKMKHVVQRTGARPALRVPGDC